MIVLVIEHEVSVILHDGGIVPAEGIRGLKCRFVVPLCQRIAEVDDSIGYIRRPHSPGCGAR